MTAPHHFTNTGRFYITSNEKQQQVVLKTSAGVVSAIWDEGEAPYDKDMLPSEVSGIIRTRIKSFWIMSDREDRLKKLDAIDARAKEFDRDFLLDRAIKLQEQAAKAWKQAMRLLDDVSDLETEMLDEVTK